MKKVIVTLLICACYFSLQGCALTDSTIRLACDKDSPEGIDKNGFRIPKIAYCQTNVLSKPEIAAISFSGILDKRSAPNPHLIYNKRNNFGKTLGLISSEEILTEYVDKSLIKGLDGEGIKIFPESKLFLSGNISRIDNEAMIGFWSVSLESYIDGEIILKTSQGEIKENIRAVGLESGLSVVDEGDYANSMRGAINDFVKKTVAFVKKYLESK